MPILEKAELIPNTNSKEQRTSTYEEALERLQEARRKVQLAEDERLGWIQYFQLQSRAAGFGP